ncbi:50S ribosomal protein L17 [Fodinibius salsisoli]|uniref:Large ribosomal subunit protein bL17 n=1 Tax=Fodinibius salsisoli TaxID=2820877 RepID=A0ABT3PTU0_9BACT|nr:50S ribosomal protein L17 [Fodinibius salsisoli]
MRHLVKGRKLGRTPSHRKATLSSLSVALIKEHRIVTTEAKAKELRSYVEPLITKAKEDTTHNRRQVFSKLRDKQVVSHLFEEVAQKAMDRPGGYTRVIKIGNRSGDGAKMAVIELVDYNDIKPEDSQKKKRTRRSGKSNKSTSGKDTSDQKTSEPVSEADSTEDSTSLEEE